MKITLVCGSPKAAGVGTSAFLLDSLSALLPDGIERETIYLNRQTITAEQADALLSADAAVIAFPLYVDGVPSQLLSCMEQLEKLCDGREKLPVVYVICNCGFFEPKHCHGAVDIMRFWTEHCGMKWGGGFSCGGGGGLDQMKGLAPLNAGPLREYGELLADVADAAAKTEPLPDRYVSVQLPGFAYKAGAHSNWRRTARKNGLKPCDLRRKLTI